MEENELEGDFKGDTEEDFVEGEEVVPLEESELIEIEPISGNLTKEEVMFAKKYALKSWNIEFKMYSEDFSNIMKYIEKANGGDAPCQFDENGLTIGFINLKLGHCARLLFPKEDVLFDYKLDTGDENNYKTIIINLKGFSDIVKPFFRKAEKVLVRIDSVKTMKVEFIFQNMVMWTRLKNPKYLIIPPFPRTMDVTNVENHYTENEVSSFTVGCTDFENICKMGRIKDEHHRDADSWTLFETSKKNGVYIKSGNYNKGRTMTLSVPVSVDDLHEQQKKRFSDLEDPKKLSKIEIIRKQKEIKMLEGKFLSGKLKSLDAKLGHSIIVNINGINLLGMLNIIGNTKMTIVKETCITIEAEIGSVVKVKLLCATPQLRFSLKEEAEKYGD